MNFNSYIFILVFVPTVVLGYHLLNQKKKYQLAQCYLLLMSFLFYAYAGIPYFILILTSILINYLISKIMEYPGLKRWCMIFGITFNLLLLFYFKYYDFFISNLNVVFHRSFVLKNIVLPLGISFYTFQQISFIIDRGKGRAPHYSLTDYSCYVIFFPQLVAGPIVKHDELIPQFHDERKKVFSWDNLYRGMALFVIGLSKKTLIADYLALAVDYGYDNIATLDSVSAFIAMLGYTLQIYFDFSGYSDMAIGLARMLNLDLPINFDRPYLSGSIGEFWRRWHITLNRFLMEYVYIPLGGSRTGKWRRVLNVMIVFFLSGLWHGANWTFILWGTLHGTLVALEGLFPKNKNRKNGIGVVRSFLLENLLWILFRSDSVSGAVQMYKRLFSFSYNGSIRELALAMDNSLLFIPIQIIKKVGLENLNDSFYLVYMLVLFCVAVFMLVGRNAYQRVRDMSPGKYYPGILALLFVFCIVCFSRTEVFLYFNF